MIKNYFISICIPSYNRPQELLRLLKSIDSKLKKEIEIVVCEDKSPRRNEIREVVKKFSRQSDYKVVYNENESNLGYDGNLRKLAENAGGEWIIYMGDDDAFVPGVLDKLILFLKEHNDLGYVLRSYNVIHYNGSVERLRYFNENKFFKAGLNTYFLYLEKAFLFQDLRLNERLFCLFSLMNLTAHCFFNCIWQRKFL